MRIGIVTFWTSDDNYGQLLQCYALQKYLRLQGHDAFLIKYAPRQQSVKAYVKEILRPIAYVVSYLICSKRLRIAGQECILRHHNRRLNKARRFDAFREAYIISVEPVYHSIKELRSNPPQADVYICGSDQIWNGQLQDINIAGYFLDFGPCTVKRVSYAASIGRTLAANEMDLFRKMLRRFDAVSVREQGAQRLCRQVGREDAVVTLDPTLLLPQCYYKKLLPKEPSTNDAILFLYILNVFSKEEIYWSQISSYMKDRNLTCRMVCSSGYRQARNVVPDMPFFPVTIPEWLSEISHATCVLTTSFHAVVFSIIMHTPFLCILLTNQYAAANDRIISLLSSLSLSDRIFDPSLPLAEQMEKTIDWTAIDTRLEILRKKSKFFLQESLSK